MTDESRQAKKLCPEDPVGDSFSPLRGVGIGKACLVFSFWGVAAPARYPVGVFSNQQKGGLQTLALGLNLNAGLIPSPTQPPEAILVFPLVQQACLVLMVCLLFGSVCLFFLFCFLSLPFLGPLPWHKEVPRLGVESEL